MFVRLHFHYLKKTSISLHLAFLFIFTAILSKFVGYSHFLLNEFILNLSATCRTLTGNFKIRVDHQFWHCIYIRRYAHMYTYEINVSDYYRHLSLISNSICSFAFFGLLLANSMQKYWPANPQTTPSITTT